jgi:hypothetical protein
MSEKIPSDARGRGDAGGVDLMKRNAVPLMTLRWGSHPAYNPHYPPVFVKEFQAAMSVVVRCGIKVRLSFAAFPTLNARLALRAGIGIPSGCFSSQTE